MLYLQGGSGVFAQEEVTFFSEWRRNYTLFEEKPSFHFRFPGMDRFLCQDVGAVMKDLMAQATAVCHCG
jgi:hypothetical protein